MSNYPLSQQGLFTPIDGTSSILHGTVAWATKQRLYDVTGVQGSGSEIIADCSPQYGFGAEFDEMASQGWVFNKHYTSGEKSSITLGNVVVRPTRWSLQKVWPLYEVSGVGPHGQCDETAKWAAGTPEFILTCEGYPLQTTGPVVRTKLVPVTFVASGIGTMTWSNDAHVETFEFANQFTKGGNSVFRFRGKIAGDMTLSAVPAADAADLKWLLEAKKPVRGTFTLDGDAETISEKAIMYDVSLKYNAAYGGHVTASTKMRVDAKDEGIYV